MVLMSKLFAEGIAHKTCNEMLHPGTCTANAVKNVYRFGFSNAKYFAPITLLPLIIKMRNFDENSLKTLKRTLKYYLHCVLVGTAVGWSIKTTMCIFRNIQGEFRYGTFVFWPSVIGSFCVALGSNRIRNLFKVTMQQCTIESFILKRKNFITRSIADSSLLQTFLFMCCSACILHGKRNGFYRGFWFLTPSSRAPTAVHTRDQTLEPENIEIVEQVSKCTHKEPNCNLYLLSGIRNYFALGLSLDIIKIIMRKVPVSQGALGKLWAKLRTFRIKNAALMTAYVAIYRYMHCLLNRHFGTNMELNHFIAAFLSGSCYIFLPKLTILSFGIALSCEIIWNMLEFQQAKKQNTHPAWLFIKNVPIGTILYTLCTGYLVHVFCLRRKYVSSMCDTIVNGITDNYARNINIKVEAMEKIMSA